MLAITGDGKFVVHKIADKTYYGKDIRHIKVFQKNDENTVYNLIYRDGARGDLFIKRFTIAGITREKVYDLTKGAENSKIVYFGVSGVNNAPNIQIVLKPRPKLKNTTFSVNFNEVLIKNRSAVGNILTKFPVHKIVETGQGKPVALPPVNDSKKKSAELFDNKENKAAEVKKKESEQSQIKMEI